MRWQESQFKIMRSEQFCCGCIRMLQRIWKFVPFWKVYRPSLKWKSTGRALFGALFKRLPRWAETFCYTKTQRSLWLGSAHLPCLNHFMQQQQAQWLVLGRRPLSQLCWYPVHLGMLCFDDFCFKDSRCLFPEACRSSAALTVTMKMVRLLDLMWYSLSPISELLCNFRDIRPVLRSIPHI